MDRNEFESRLDWSATYNTEWDANPNEYAENRRVGWGRSRRLAALRLPAAPGDPGFKAYIGVQHIDPGRGGWGNFDAPQARFFISWFAGRRTVGLRTFPTMALTRDALWQAYVQHCAQVERIRAAHGITVG